MAAVSSTGPDTRRVLFPDDVLLRRPTEADVPGLWAVHGDPAVYAFDPVEVHRDHAHTAGWLTPITEHWQRHGFGYWVVLVPSTWWPDGVAGADPADEGRVVAGMGGIRWYEKPDGERVLNVYYRLAPAVHGRGLAGMVIRESVRAAAAVLPGTDLVVRTRPANAAARRVAQRAGFVDLGPDPADPGMQLLRRQNRPAGPAGGDGPVASRA